MIQRKQRYPVLKGSKKWFLVNTIRKALTVLFLCSSITSSSQTNSLPPLLKWDSDSGNAKRISINKLSSEIERLLRDSVAGIGYQIWQKNNLVKSGSFGYKIMPIDTKDGRGVAFDNDSRMHVASISKTITALALAVALNKYNIKWDDLVAKYLPPDWEVHSGFKNLSFAKLLQMKSGINEPLDAISSDYDSLKNITEKGPDTSKVNKYNYQNAAYGLIRVLITGIVKKSWPEEVDNDYLKSMVANTYVNFVNEVLFQPAGIEKVYCNEDSDNPVLIYPSIKKAGHGLLSGFPGIGATYTNGDLSQYAGGIGWHISVNELGQLLNQVYTTEKIITRKALNELISLGFPLRAKNGKYGQSIAGSGAWVWEKHTETNKYVCALFTFYIVLPDDIIITVFINSQLMSSGNGLEAKIRTACESALQ